MKSVVLLLVLSLLSPSATPAQKAPPGPVRHPMIIKKIDPDILWSFAVSPSDEHPSTVVSLIVGKRKFRIAKVGNVQHTLSRAEYAGNNVPKTAVTASYGWWAGGGDVFYAVKKSRKLRVYHRWIEENEGPSEKAKLVKTIKL